VLEGPVFTGGGAAVVFAAHGHRADRIGAALVGYVPDPVSGLLRRQSCLSTPRRPGCRLARGLTMPAFQGLSLTADGRNAYVAAGFRLDANELFASAPRALTSFRLDPSSGVLRQLAGAAGCVSPARRRVAGCARIPDTAGELRGGEDFLQPAMEAPVLSPDGRSLYVFDTTSIIAFSRDPATGALRRLPGRAWCVRGDRGTRACRHVGRLIDEIALHMSPDGRFLTFLGGDALVQLRRATG